MVDEHPPSNFQSGLSPIVEFRLRNSEDTIYSSVFKNKNKLDYHGKQDIRINIAEETLNSTHALNKDKICVFTEKLIARRLLHLVRLLVSQNTRQLAVHSVLYPKSQMVQ